MKKKTSNARKDRVMEKIANSGYYLHPAGSMLSAVVPCCEETTQS